MSEKNIGRQEIQEKTFTFILQHPAGQCPRAAETIQATFEANTEHQARILAENSYVCDLCTARYQLL